MRLDIVLVGRVGQRERIAPGRSVDGVTWGDAIALTDTPGEDDVEPHPLVGASSTEVELYWGRDVPAGSLTQDIVREAHAPVLFDAIFDDGFDSA
jgi:hypothetical protein